MLRLRCVAALALLALPTVLLGCGSASVDGSAVAKAATKTDNVSGSHFVMSMTITAATTGPIRMTISGDENVPSHSMRATLDMSDFAKLAGAKGGPPSGWRGDVVVDGSNGGFVEYLRLPVLQRALPPGKTWVSIDVAKLLQRQGGLDLNQLMQQSSTMDPAQSLQLLRSVSNLEQDGTATVDGVSTARWDGAVDVKKLAARYGGANGAEVQKLYERLGVTSIPISVWIGNDDGYVHRLRMHYAATASSAGRMTFGIDVDMSKYGESVTVTPPPADQVTDLSQLTPGATG